MSGGRPTSGARRPSPYTPGPAAQEAPAARPAGERAEAQRRHDTVRHFLELSAALTGYDTAELQGTGMVEAYLDFTWRAVGSRVIGELLTAWCDLQKGSGGAPTERSLRAAILASPRLGPVARNVVVLWYLGQWNQLPADWRDRHGADAVDQNGIISPEAYVQGLVWDAIGTHPQGAKQPGYGSWALPPKQLEDRP